MSLTDGEVGLINVGLSDIPALINLIKGIHTAASPDAPPLTDSQVLAVLVSLGTASIAKDNAWKATHTG